MLETMKNIFNPLRNGPISHADAAVRIEKTLHKMEKEDRSSGEEIAGKVLKDIYERGVDKNDRGLAEYGLIFHEKMGWTANCLTADVLELIASGTPASTEVLAGHAVQHIANSSFDFSIVTAELALQYLAGHNPTRGTPEIVNMASRLARSYTKEADSTTDPWLEGTLKKTAIACYQEALTSLAGVDIKEGKKVATNRIPAAARLAGAIMMPGAVEAVLADILIRAAESMERSQLTDHLVADFIKEGLSHLAGYTGNAGLEIIAREGVTQIDKELDASTEALIKGFPNSHDYKKKAVTRGKIALDNILNYRDNPSYSESVWKTDGNSERKVIIEEKTDVLIDGLRLKKNAMM